MESKTRFYYINEKIHKFKNDPHIPVIFQHHKQWALILTTIWSASQGKKKSLFSFNIVTKNKETHPGRVDYSPATVIINSYIPEQHSTELGKDQLLMDMIQANILDPTNSFQEIPELQCHWWLYI